jgi:hypothetical protein
MVPDRRGEDKLAGRAAGMRVDAPRASRAVCRNELRGYFRFTITSLFEGSVVPPKKVFTWTGVIPFF